MLRKRPADALDMAMSTPTDPRRIAALLRLRAQTYFAPEHGAVLGVDLVQSLPRPYSQLYRFRIRYARAACDVIVKVSPDRNDVAASALFPPDRPRIAPPADTEAACEREYAALSRIGEYYDSIGDPRFGVVRVLDLIPEQNAFVMEAIDEPTLREFALQNGRVPSRRSLREVCAVFNHCGAWLRAYHSMPLALPSVHVDAEEFVRFNEQLAAFIARRTANHAFFAWVGSGMRELAASVLADPLPMGVAHGDYAMRNVLVGSGGRVTVLDTPARYRACIYRDIAMHLTDLQWSRVPALGGASLVHVGRSAAYRNAFFGGYFGSSTHPLAAVKLYEAQALLERFASYVARRASARTSARTPVLLAQDSAWSAYFTSRLRKTIALARTEQILRRPA